MSSVDDHHTTREPRVHNRLAETRQQRGVAAAELARRAGISRQTIYAMEAGSYVPNTAVALRLARILEVTVEELFALDPDRVPQPRVVKAELASENELFPGAAVELCRVGSRLVAVPATPAPLQLLPADGLLVDPKRSAVQLIHENAGENRLLIAGCDPATSVLARHLQRAGATMVSAPVNSSTALRLLQRKMTHVAGTHLHSGQIPRRGVSVFAFAVWEEGIVAARGNPRKIRSVEDLARPGIRLINREKGSGSRQLLDRLLQECGIPVTRVDGYEETPASGHLPAAWRVYSGLADCCIATRSAARAFGLDFLPLTSERYDLVIRKEHLELAAVERLLDVLAQAAFRRELDALCGYDTRETGRRMS